MENKLAEIRSKWYYDIMRLNVINGAKLVNNFKY